MPLPFLYLRKVTEAALKLYVSSRPKEEKFINIGQKPVGDKWAARRSRRLFGAFSSLAKALRSRQTITGKDQRALAGRKIGAINEVEDLGT
jgi:hypothetical protein